MNKIMSKMFLVLITIGVIGFSGININAGTLENFTMTQGKQDFVLINKTGVEIYALYVTPHNADDWGEDILGVDTLAAGESIEINFSPKERAKLWDVRIEDQEGEYIEWENLNLTKISSVALYYKNGKATAIVK